LDRREEKVAEERKILNGPPSKNDALEEAVTVVQRALDAALAKIASATSDRDSWSAWLQERRGAAASVDIVALAQVEGPRVLPRATTVPRRRSGSHQRARG
jgi:hypothetical protein